MTIDQVINPLASITLFELMLAIGLGASFGDVVGVVRDWGLVTRAALANYVCVPAAAMGLLMLFHSEPLVAAGFLIAAVCPGAPYGPPFTGMARGNQAVSVGLMVILAGSSALLVPLLLAVLLPLLRHVQASAPSTTQSVEVPALKVVFTLLIAQFLPLCLGLAVRRWRPALAATLKKPADRLSVVLNLLLLGLIFYAQRSTLMDVPLRAYGGMTALVAAGVLSGWLLGGPGKDNRTAMVMATGVRNVGVSLVIATGSFPAGSEAVTATTVFALFQTVLMALVAATWGRPNTPGRLRPDRTSAAELQGGPTSGTIAPGMGNLK
jgi:BASS family bile acid:Na+ symporter